MGTTNHETLDPSLTCNRKPHELDGGTVYSVTPSDCRTVPPIFYSQEKDTPEILDAEDLLLSSGL